MSEKIIHHINDLIVGGIGCRSKIHKLIREGKLIARKNGGNTVILDEDLKNYLQSLPRQISSGKSFPQKRTADAAPKLLKSSALTGALGVNALTICDCGGTAFKVGLSYNPETGNNFIRALECVACAHQMPATHKSDGGLSPTVGFAGRRG